MRHPLHFRDVIFDASALVNRERVLQVWVTSSTSSSQSRSRSLMAGVLLEVVVDGGPHLRAGAVQQDALVARA